MMSNGISNAITNTAYISMKFFIWSASLVVRESFSLLPFQQLFFSYAHLPHPWLCPVIPTTHWVASALVDAQQSTTFRFFGRNIPASRTRTCYNTWCHKRNMPKILLFHYLCGRICAGASTPTPMHAQWLFLLPNVDIPHRMV